VVERDGVIVKLWDFPLAVFSRAAAIIHVVAEGEIRNAAGDAEPVLNPNA
jgi:hypothetical protein